MSPTTLSLDTSLGCGGGPYSGLGYLWLETPCGGEYLNTISTQYVHNIYTLSTPGEAACPLYSADQYRTPVAPFMLRCNAHNCL